MCFILSFKKNKKILLNFFIKRETLCFNIYYLRVLFITNSYNICIAEQLPQAVVYSKM